MALRRQVVDLVGTDLAEQADEVGRVGEIAIVQEHVLVRRMRILVYAIDPAGVERRRTPLQTVDFIALVEKQLGKIGAILPRDAGNERFLGHAIPLALREGLYFRFAEHFNGQWP